MKRRRRGETKFVFHGNSYERGALVTKLGSCIRVPVEKGKALKLRARIKWVDGQYVLTAYIKD